MPSNMEAKEGAKNRDPGRSGHEAQEFDTDKPGWPEAEVADLGDASGTKHGTGITMPSLNSGMGFDIEVLVEKLSRLRLSTHELPSPSPEGRLQELSLSSSSGQHVQTRSSLDPSTVEYVPTLRGGQAGKKRRAARRNRRSTQYSPSSSSSSSSSPSSPPPSSSPPSRSQSPPAQPPPTPTSTPTQPPSPSIPGPNHNFSSPNRHEPLHKTNKKIWQKLLSPLSRRERRPQGGYIYAYTFPPNHQINGGLHPSFPLHPSASLVSGEPLSPDRDTISFVKIGQTGSLGARMRQIEHKCGFQPVLLLRAADTDSNVGTNTAAVQAFKMPFFPRFEAVVHAQLQNRRRIELDCPGCFRRHREWFAVSPAEAERVVHLWARWAETRPYGPDGQLWPIWRHRLEGLDLSDEKCWESFVWGKGGEEVRTGDEDEDVVMKDESEDSD